MTLLRTLFETLRDLARELSDEAAYGRYLSANGKAPSGAEWPGSGRRWQGRFPVGVPSVLPLGS